VAELPADAPARDRLPELRWMIEELRVSLFAQQLGTAAPVSAQRVWRLIDELR
jgi:ATP-dependent helicase HrpA